MGIARRGGAEPGRKVFEGFAVKRKGRYPKLGLWPEKAEGMLIFYEFPEGSRGSYTRTIASNPSTSR